MDRADDHELCGRRVDVEEQLFSAGLDIAALAHPQLLGKLDAQRIGGDVRSLHQALLAIGGVGDDDDRAARGALGVELFQDLELHG